VSPNLSRTRSEHAKIEESAAVPAQQRNRLVHAINGKKYPFLNNHIWATLDDFGEKMYI